MVQKNFFCIPTQLWNPPPPCAQSYAFDLNPRLLLRAYVLCAWTLKKWMTVWILSIKMFLKLSQSRIIWYLLGGFKTIILCSVYSLRFVKCFFWLKYGSWKIELELWNTNRESWNRTLVTTWNFELYIVWVLLLHPS